MHSAHSNINNYDMKSFIGYFPLCGGCSRREKSEKLREGEYNCAIAKSFLPNGIVTNDTDATECVRKGWYSPAKL